MSSPLISRAILCFVTGAASACRYNVYLDDAGDAAVMDAARDASDEPRADVSSALESSTDATSIDVAIDASAQDASADAVTDSVDVAVTIARDRTSGLRLRGVSIAKVESDPAGSFALFYIGRDGMLWVETRDANSFARTCQASLGRPMGTGTLVGTPSVTPSGRLVAVAGESAGTTALWTRELDFAAAPSCGFLLGEWRSVTERGAAISVTSAGSVLEIGATDYLAYLDATQRPLVQSRSSGGAWLPVPRPAPLSAMGEFAAAPVLHTFSTLLRVFSMANPVSGEQYLIDAEYDGAEWLPGWWTIETPLALVGSAPTVAVVASGAFNQRHQVYADPVGNVWHSRVPNRPDDAVQSAWASIARPGATSDLSSVTLGFRRSTGLRQGALMMVMVTQSAPAIAYASTWDGTAWTGATRGWDTMPDPLQ